MEREKKYYKYRYNPAFPNCKEEHIYYIVLISEEDQKIMDDYIPMGIVPVHEKKM